MEMHIKEVEVQLRAVRVYAHCDKCGARLGDAFPLPHGYAYNDKGERTPINEHEYLYTCPVCGAHTESDECYPRIEYRELEP